MPASLRDCPVDGKLPQRPLAIALFSVVPPKEKFRGRRSVTQLPFGRRSRRRSSAEKFRSPVAQVFLSRFFDRSDDFRRWRLAASAAQDAAVTSSTRSQRCRSWELYTRFLRTIGHHGEPVLEKVDGAERVEVFACFAAALREGLPHDARGTLEPCRPGRQSITICAALNGVAQAFRTNKLVSPIHNARGRFDTILAAHLRGYSIDDPETRQSQAIPAAAVVARVAAADATELHQAISQLVVGAFFFAMRACAFSEVNGPRRTWTVTVGDVEFRRDGRKIESDDEAEMAAADTVLSLTFRTQKNGEKGRSSHNTEPLDRRWEGCRFAQ